MKAKHIAKIRRTHRLYSVQLTSGVFGEFYGILARTPHIVLAKDERHACKRLKRRGIGLGKEIYDSPMESEDFARWKVRELAKPEHFRYIKYF